MFCSRCGKTVDPEATKCKYCETPIGESRFEGVPYTSAQSHIVPGEDSSAFHPRTYTRTTYTGGDYEEQYDGDADVATSYRPVYDPHSVPEEVRDELEAEEERRRQEELEAARAEEAAQEMTEEEMIMAQMPPIDINDIKDFDISKIKARPIVAQNPRGFSSEVEEYVRKLEQDSGRPSRRGKHLSANDPYRDEAEPEAPMDEEEVTDDDDDYFEESRGLDIKRILTIVAALVAVAALVVAGIYIAPKLLGKFRQEATVPIEGVSLELYNSGIDLIEKHTGQEYVDGVLATYENGGYVALTTRLNSDQAEITALMPENPSTNDQLFIDAVSKIQDDIGSAITMDAVEKQSTGVIASQDSQERWANVNESITAIKAVNSASGLSAIVAGERIVAVIETPTPEPLTTPAPQYTTLSKGDDSEDVKAMQQRLYDLGYLEDEADGKFGNNTQTAVKLFQQQAGLEVTGVADNDTQTVLFSDDAPMTADAKITPVPDPTDEPLQPAEIGNDAGADNGAEGDGAQ